MALSSIILCVIYGVYLIFGGLIFMSLEYEIILVTSINEAPQWTRLKEITQTPHLTVQNKGEMRILLKWIQSDCKDLTPQLTHHLLTSGDHKKDIVKVEERCGNFTKEETHPTYKYPWSFIDALYFAMTAVTTIGYGHLAPSTTSGQVACILYTVIGIPLTGTLLAWTSSFFGERLFTLFRAMVDAENRKSKGVIGLVAAMYVLVGFVIFIFLPALIFMVIEGWGYFRSVYFAYITLTTIGFGDYVTGRNMSGDWLYVYQICVITWILAGLGYWLMIASFLTKALRKEKIQALARRAAAIRKIISQLGPHPNAEEAKTMNKDSKETLNFLVHLARGIALPEDPQKANINSSKNPNPTQSPEEAQFRGIARLLAGSNQGQVNLIQKLANLEYLSSILEESQLNDNSNDSTTPSKSKLADSKPIGDPSKNISIIYNPNGDELAGQDPSEDGHSVIDMDITASYESGFSEDDLSITRL